VALIMTVFAGHRDFGPSYAETIPSWPGETGDAISGRRGEFPADFWRRGGTDRVAAENDTSPNEGREGEGGLAPSEISS